jgi:hypothetical protein
VPVRSRLTQRRQRLRPGPRNLQKAHPFGSNDILRSLPLISHTRRYARYHPGSGPVLLSGTTACAGASLESSQRSGSALRHGYRQSAVGVRVPPEALASGGRLGCLREPPHLRSLRSGWRRVVVPVRHAQTMFRLAGSVPPCCCSDAGCRCRRSVAGRPVDRFA